MLTREFVCDAIYFSREDKEGIESKLTLILEPKPLVIPMRSHLIGPEGIVSASPPGNGGGISTFRSGRFFLVS
jgi:hypothetical protein